MQVSGPTSSPISSSFRGNEQHDTENRSDVCRRGDTCGRLLAHSSVREPRFTGCEDADPQWGRDRFRNAWIDPACLSELPFTEYGVAVLRPHCADVLADGARCPPGAVAHEPFTLAGIF